ncbi:MAG TPA: IclR family transcriptional regulator [Castellaniella sp.]|uniref:IclR family transcriptional regulator n=1 Tax=Castellaniella sp. TaxID=1955812 RepID=UPI002EE96B14
MTSARPDNKKNTVQSLAKGLKILTTFSPGEPELTMAEIARRADVDNATAFRYLNTLVDLGYVRRVPDSRLFSLTLQVLDLGFNAIAHSNLRTVAHPILRELVGEVNEAASIGVLDGTEICYVERFQRGLTRMGVDIRIGTRVPACTTVIGHSLLAWLPTSRQQAIFNGHRAEKRTDRHPVDPETLLQRLTEVRARGYSISLPDQFQGFYAIAAPILDQDQVPIGAISTAAPAISMTLEQFEAKSAGPVCHAARQLGTALQSLGGFAHLDP